MNIKKLLVFGVLIVFACVMWGCGDGKKSPDKQITLTVRTAPLGLGDIPGVGEAETADFFKVAGERFNEQYDEYDVNFEIIRYNYTDEQEQLIDKYGTDEAADIFYSGSWNTSSFAYNGWLVPLDDIIDEELRADIPEAIWQQNTFDGKVYTLPFQQFQSTLGVNRGIMEAAGLDRYIPEEGTIAQWSTEEFNEILSELNSYLSEETSYPFMMYAKNNQGDSHIMTLLMAYGNSLYDEDGNFNVNTPEGIEALEWLKSLDERDYTPQGPENLEFLDCVNLFYNNQMAICSVNLVNYWDATAKGIDVFLANYPSLDGNGYATSSSNGFCVFDNGDETKIKVAKDFIKYIYTDEELMKYTLGSTPVNQSVVDRYKNEIFLLDAYAQNSENIVKVVQTENTNWQGVRDAFYLNIQDLLKGTKTPAEVAAAIDETCNAALEKGRRQQAEAIENQ